MQVKFNAEEERYDCGRIQAILRNEGIPDPLAWEERVKGFVVVEVPLGTPTTMISDAVDRCVVIA